LEVYGRNRFFAFTSKRINWHTQIHDCSDALDKLLRRMQPKTLDPVMTPRRNKKESPKLAHSTRPCRCRTIRSHPYLHCGIGSLRRIWTE
jgi:hypothetical protein